MNQSVLMLIDGNSLINRAFFGLYGRQNLTAPDGTPTGALFAFLNMYLKYLDDLKPTHVCAAFDLKEATFRNEWFDGYKATRKPMPDELAVQMPILKELLDDLGVGRIELAGYEADDLIGTLARLGAEAGMQVIIITGDKDSFQLINDHVTVLQPVTRQGKTESERYDADKVFQRYQISPAQIIDLKAIMGDPSDNIPGVKGIGEKGAIELVSRYGSVENIYDHLGEIRPLLAKKLTDNREMAFLSKRLATICLDVPFAQPLSDWQMREMNQKDLVEKLNRLGFKSLLSRLSLSLHGSGSATPASSRDHHVEQPTLAQWPGLLARLRSDQWLSLALSESGAALLLISQEQDDHDLTCLIPADLFPLVWAMLARPEQATLRLALMDYKTLLRKKDLPRLPFLPHDILIAAYLLNQMDGRADLDRIYQSLTGQMISRPNQADAPRQIDLFAAPDEAADTKDGADRDQLIRRLVPEARAILAVAGIQVTQIRERSLQVLFSQIEMPLSGILADMERQGFLIDLAMLEEMSADLLKKSDDLQAEIFRMCDCTFNLNSPKQLGEVLFERIGLKTGKKRTGGNYSTDSDELERLRDEHPAIPLIIEHRQLAKLRSTFVEGLRKAINPANGRVHTTFNQTLTATGRLSSSDPNLQNIPIRSDVGARIRELFVARPGCVLLDADYSQIELRLLAHLSDDPDMIRSFREREDIHRNTACRIFSVAPDRVTAFMRSAAKTVNFSIVYGISDFGLARDLGISLKEAHRYISEYNAQYPGVRAYLDQVIAKAYELGYVETLFGRRRYLHELKSPNRNLRQFGERAAMNTPIQGTAADLIKLAMVKADAQIRQLGLGSRLILQVHDELIVESPTDEADQASILLQQAMEQAVELKVPLLADVHQGLRWSDSKG